jgi:hypothetical protein
MKASGLLIVIGLATVSATARVAEAYPSDTTWSTPAIGCQVASTTTAHPPNYDYTYGEVNFATGDTGTFHLVCPITALSYNDNWDSWAVTYNDEDSGSGCEISAALRYHSLTTGTSGTAESFTGTGGGTSPYLQTYNYSIDSVDLDDDAYWVDITVTRTDSSLTYCSVNSTALTYYFFGG